jgi:ribonuclease P protein component
VALLNSTDKRSGFSKQQRLDQPSQYKALFDSPDYRFSNRAFLMLAKNNPLGFARLGLVTSKKKAKRAVDRNLVKRLTRESFRLRQHQLNSLDVLVLLRSFPTESSRQELRAQLEELWAKLLAKAHQD